MECADTNKDGLLDYKEFTERFHQPAENIGRSPECNDTYCDINVPSFMTHKELYLNIYRMFIHLVLNIISQERQLSNLPQLNILFTEMYS